MPAVKRIRPVCPEFNPRCLRGQQSTLQVHRLQSLKVPEVSVFVSKRVVFAPSKLWFVDHTEPRCRNHFDRRLITQDIATMPPAPRFGAKSLPKTRDRQARVMWRLRSLCACVRRSYVPRGTRWPVSRGGRGLLGCRWPISMATGCEVAARVGGIVFCAVDPESASRQGSSSG
jgi:hypothetical protein